jgi:hypothetical protein
MNREHTTRPSTISRSVAVAIAAAALLAGLGACGGSSKPAYCSKRTTLEDSVKGLKSLDTSNGVSAALRSQVTKIQADATGLVSSAKSDFPSESAALKSSVNTFASTVKALPSSPSVANLAALASSGKAVTSAVKSFTDATNSKCG